jgi:hypothetical protein
MQNDGSNNSNKKPKNSTKIQRNTKTVSWVSLNHMTTGLTMTGMMTHQIEFSKAIQEIYKPISGRASDPNSAKPEGNAEGIKACDEYEAAVKDLQDTLKPELEMLETRIIQPANDLLAIVKQTQKMLTKRNHKLLDYDRTHPSPSLPPRLHQMLTGGRSSHVTQKTPR